jgi:hypothetical protein
MPLISMATPYGLRARVLAAPSELRHIVLRAVNPALANELVAVEENPSQASSRVRKLDAESAEQLVEFVNDPQVLRALHASERRDGVSSAIRSRASDLNVDLYEVDRPETTPAGTNLGLRTAKALAKPFDAALIALSKMATVDEPAVRAWCENFGQDTDWGQVLSQLGRHYTVRSQVLTDAIEREAVSIDKLLPGNESLLFGAIQSYKGALNPTAIQAIEVTLAAGFSLNEGSFELLTDEARTHLDTAGPLVRILCGVATPEEAATAYNDALVSEQEDNRHRHMVEAIVSCVRTPEIAIALAPLLSKEVTNNGFSRYWRLSYDAAARFVVIPGIDQETTRICWSHLSASLEEVVRGKLGPKPTEADITWLLERFADPDDDNFNVDNVLNSLDYGERSSEVDNFVDRVLAELPGGAASVLNNARRWGTPWLVETALKRAGEKLGTNAAAWAVFMKEVDGFNGLMDELIEAAIIATA